MGLFDWFTGLFSSKNDEENKTSENNIERDDDKDQADKDSSLQDVHEIASETIESEIQTGGEADDIQRNDDEPQVINLK